MAAKRVNESGVWCHVEKVGEKLCSRLIACTGSLTSGLKHQELLVLFAIVTCVGFLILVRNTNL